MAGRRAQSSHGRQYRAPSGFGEQPWIDDPRVSPVYLREGPGEDEEWELPQEAIGQKVDCSTPRTPLWRISKALTSIMRHNADKEGMPYDPAGWFDINQMRAHLAGQMNSECTWT